MDKFIFTVGTLYIISLGGDVVIKDRDGDAVGMTRAEAVGLAEGLIKALSQ